MLPLQLDAVPLAAPPDAKCGVWSALEDCRALPCLGTCHAGHPALIDQGVMLLSTIYSCCLLPFACRLLIAVCFCCLPRLGTFLPLPMSRKPLTRSLHSLSQLFFRELDATGAGSMVQHTHAHQTHDAPPTHHAHDTPRGTRRKSHNLRQT